MRLRSLLWAIALIALAPLPAKADLITVSFGQACFPTPDRPICYPPSPVGALNGTYVYDSTEPGFPLGEYTAYIAVRSFEFSVGSQSFSGSTGLIQVGSEVHRFPGLTESIYDVTLPAAPGYTLNLQLYTPSAFFYIPSDEPLIEPELSDFERGGAGQGFIGNQFFALNHFTTVVPEPSTWLMLSMGLSLVGIAARRRRTTLSNHQ